MTNKDRQQSWIEYSQYVLNSIKEMKDLREKITEFQIELAVLKVKVTLWGAIGGVAGTFIGTLAIQFIMHYLKSIKG